MCVCVCVCVCVRLLRFRNSFAGGVRVGTVSKWFEIFFFLGGRFGNRCDRFVIVCTVIRIDPERIHSVRGTDSGICVLRIFVFTLLYFFLNQLPRPYLTNRVPWNTSPPSPPVACKPAHPSAVGVAHDSGASKIRGQKKKETKNLHTNCELIVVFAPFCGVVCIRLWSRA